MGNAAIIVNRSAGSAHSVELVVETAAAALEKRGLRAIAHPVDPAHLQHVLDAIDPADIDLIVIGGGDGSIRAAARRAIDTGLPLAVLPMGTMNLVARDLRLPTDPVVAAAAIADAHERAIDVALVNGKLFLHSILLGVAPLLGTQRERLRFAGSAGEVIDAAACALDTVLYQPPLQLTVCLEDECHQISTFMLAVSANRLRATLREPLARDSLHDGTLGVYWSTHEGLAGLTQLMTELGVGLWTLDSRVEQRTTTRLTLESPERSILVGLDGENHTLRTPLEVSIQPLALRVLVPAGSDPDLPPRDGA